MNDIATFQQTQRFSLTPTSLAEAMEFAKFIAQADIVPKDFQGKPGNVLVAIQWGNELGLHPLQAMQSIAIINNRPTLWGDAQLALVQSSPHYEAHEEGTDGEGDQMVGWCKVKRRGQEWHEVRFDVGDAKQANLWGKAGPWQQYKKRMLKLRARGFALRDKFADVLRGIPQTEETMDEIVVGSGSTEDAERQSTGDRLKEAAKGAAAKATKKDEAEAKPAKPATKPGAPTPDEIIKAINAAKTPDALTAAIDLARGMEDGPEKDRIRAAYSEKLLSEKAKAAAAPPPAQASNDDPGDQFATD